MTVASIKARLKPAEYAAFMRASGEGSEAEEEVVEEKDVLQEEETGPGHHIAEHISTI